MDDSLKMIAEKIQQAELVLVGVGENFETGRTEAELGKAYQTLRTLLEGKNYFIITLCADKYVRTAGMREERIVCPLQEEENDSRWEMYMKWLQGTVNRRLLVLELEVGLKYPNVIRFPFEKMIYFNQKADFIRIHDKLFQLPAELGGRGTSLAENAAAFLASAEDQKYV